MDLSISIVSWNTRDLLDQCLRSVYETVKGIEFEVIVVDNASSDGSAEMVRQKYPQARLIENAENVGFARANNQAYGISNGENFLLLNPDTVVLPEAIHRLLTVMDEYDSCAVVAPKLLWSDRSLQPSVARFPTLLTELSDSLYISRIVRGRRPSGFFLPDDNAVSEIPSASGACLLVRRQALADSAAVLDDRFFIFSEETDLCRTLHERGWKACYEPRAVVVHLGSASTARASREMRARLYESKYVYFSKHHGRLYAGIYRFLVVPIGCLLRLVGFLPNLVLSKEATHRETHPVTQVYLLKHLLTWRRDSQHR